MAAPRGGDGDVGRGRTQCSLSPGGSDPVAEGSRRVLLTIEYDGTRFHGWQRQPGVDTIQGRIEESIHLALRERVTVEGASRTDRGVHACAQSALFETRTPVPTERVPRVLNKYLPEDIRVSGAEDALDGYQPRSDSFAKVYRYSFLVRAVESAFLGRFTARIDRRLDAGALREAAAALVGVHDFDSFRNQSRDPPGTSVREVYAALVVEEPPLLHLLFAGSGFLYNMVRNMAGTLREVGEGRRSPGSMPALLRAKDRRAAGPKAEARGLCLLRVCRDRPEMEEALRRPSLLDGWSGPGRVV